MDWGRKAAPSNGEAGAAAEPAATAKKNARAAGGAAVPAEENAPTKAAPGAAGEAPAASVAFEPTRSEGLTNAEVAALTAAGKANVDAGPQTKTIPVIVRDHLCTLFNALNLALAALVFFTGSYRNMLFLLVVGANILIGIVQEVRSKRAVDALTVVARRPLTVRREGREVAIEQEALVEGDLVLLAHGDQVPADLIVREGTLSMNESLLTGESRAVKKGPGSELFSGSFVLEGSCVAQAVQVGEGSYAARLTAEAKRRRPPRSQIMATLRSIITFASWVIVPVGVGLFLRALGSTESISEAILSMVAAVVGMIPQGLVLLTSSVLAIATMRLARQNVLVQQLYCIETLARVDTLCLDKTGTLTSGAMTLEAFLPAAGVARHQLVEAAIAVVGASAQDANDTATALLTWGENNQIAPAPAARVVPFSSERKYSGVTTQDGHSYVLGAASFVLGPARVAALEAALDAQVDAAATAHAEKRGEAGAASAAGAPGVVGATAPTPPEALLGTVTHTKRTLTGAHVNALARVLVVAEVEGFGEGYELVGEPRLLGEVALLDQVRTTAPGTLAYFARQGVDIKVISGDDAATVAAIAQEAGLSSAGAVVDASTLTTQQALEEAAATASVFGRVKPEQKRELVQALQRQGHTVAMTGDGVNDVLALLEADCSIAMASGSDAARNVAELVLVDNDFSHLPQVVAEGRQSINNLERSSSLFLEKTIFSLMVGIICIVAPPYPLLPIQMTLISTYLIGIPSFVLALETNHERVRGNFLQNVLKTSMPAALAVVFALLAVVIGREFFAWSTQEVSSLATALVAVVGLSLLAEISRPFTPLRAILWVAMCACVVLGIVVFANFFQVARFTVPMIIFFLVVGAASWFLFKALWRRAQSHSGAYRGRIARKIAQVEKSSYEKRGI